MKSLLYILDAIIYIMLAFNVLYLLIFSIASRCRKPATPPVAKEHKRFALLIAAYREDAVIMDTVQKCLAQDYPSDKFDVVVISDHMKEETNKQLSALPITLLQVDFEKSTNTKSLQAALNHLGKDAYDIALVIDADNIIQPSYLSEVNNAFAQPGVKVVQTHRTAKNLNTDMAYLDAVSEEINNSIFRLGHVNLGMSAALIGSGMAFQYSLFYDAMMSNTSVGGFDRVLELKLLHERIFIHYLPDTYVLDEKIQHTSGFYNQRRRWLAAQYYSLIEFAYHFMPALRSRKWDFCDKLFQQATLSRVLLLGTLFIIALFHTFFFPSLSVKWWGLFILVGIALILAIPPHLMQRRLLKAACIIPYSFLLMFFNLFRLKEANKRFIHTEHGVQETPKQS